MLDTRHIEQAFGDVETALARRGPGVRPALEALAGLATKRRTQLVALESRRAERNVASEAMASLDPKSEAFAARRSSLRELSTATKALETELKETEEALSQLLDTVPNLPHASVPDGTSEADNVVMRTWGSASGRAAGGMEANPAEDHVAVAERLGLLDMAAAAKLSGARFVVLRKEGARLLRALINWMLETHLTAGYEEVWVPAILNEAALRGTGQLPKFEEDQFELVRVEGEGRRFLSPTAEVALTNLHAGDLLAATDLPKRFVAYAPCFRREAGSYGRDTRGMIRNHQFDKVELVHLVAPEAGEAALEELCGAAERILQGLNLHYRVVSLCAGDLGFSARKTYDLEVWLPSAGAFREISSCSWCGDFQARRAQIRYRPEGSKKTEFVHTLNGSGVAVGRAFVAVLEQYQQADGSMVVPEVLRPFMGGQTVLRA